MTEKTSWTAGGILAISGGYWQSFALHTAVKLGIFTILGEDRVSAAGVAARLDASERGVAPLLNALSAMGLVVKKGEIYKNTEESKRLLAKQAPGYIGHIIMHHHHLGESWGRLDESVRTGKPVRVWEEKDEERESFLMGMFNLAMGIAPGLAKEIDLAGRRRLLDLGGGPGTYAIHFCLENPGLRATVFDLAETKPFALKTIERFGLQDRVDFVSGDYVTEPIPGRYDVAWLSHILHGEGKEDCRRIIDKAVSTLEPGGHLLVHDFLLENTLDGPLFPALFSLNMLVNTAEGRAYSEKEVMTMLTDAGLKDLQRLSFRGPNDSGIIRGFL